ncbi:hypothetical protein A2697_00330 [Candidatus Curtissbacteria bacterium RIFCSPHIGHO2_01_FULL_41_44]|uniref:Uncharacterized protein n=1 Tax=Candidatus Curtissbacteria bacterium RIFCSPLOWO2_01_FULL_42_50 TaxID=1797730 RepID=A0A1F5H5U6_9BACT|nr:MAG: hypothetical protein A2697_00330 [Candidatus Curtissbacteria bacterium RIFCSPHIGHO2_01_FULL_41_44]OGD93421.1 MAG: hypothetical protein A3C33_03565 [Candidatus Curtissbacteria bacterium RIFCSPHIGHO2_02_FULL_42_58]OGD97144.1 MAG: hypothetical protein A3E71_02975 [Candidatus Curtissbacteria bacterium RIFCSPHIGHO2_12_FULL_42_33]OGD99533.1 MAG: hypothetical protein A3B54_03470 [Candidatus Curtissbacteria bacterium RIFCSPLOWO2_01_FULL_42_50]OGE02278.1 MAG: hypothetical protein A3G16_01285 [Ca
MVTRSLVKLIDEAIIPAVSLICGKMIGLLASSYFLHLPFTFKNGQFLKILPSVQFQSLEAYTTAENYSNLVMFLVAAAGTVYVLVRAHYFHESHIHPSLHAKLVAIGQDWLVAPSYHLYHQAVIWLVFLWLTVGFLVLSTILGTTYPQIAIIAFVVAANFSWVLAVDIEKEIELGKSQ